MASSVSPGTAFVHYGQLLATAAVRSNSGRGVTCAQASSSCRCHCGGTQTGNKVRRMALQSPRAPVDDACQFLRSWHQKSPQKLGCKRKGVPQASRDDFDFSGGPIDDVRPTFTREAYKVPPPDPPKEIPDNPRKRKGRPQVTPPQAIVGSVIAAGCSVALFNFVRDAYFYVAEHPPVNRAPFQLEGDINALICTFVAGFGGFAVLLFAVNSAGLALLAVKGLTSPASNDVENE